MKVISPGKIYETNDGTELNFGPGGVSAYELLLIVNQHLIEENRKAQCVENIRTLFALREALEMQERLHMAAVSGRH